MEYDENVHNLDGIGLAFSALMNFIAVLAVIVGLVFAVLVVMAALGLTSFSVLELFRRKDRRARDDAHNGGIDDLF
jgi:SNF family Na+-dependent transporter